MVKHVILWKLKEEYSDEQKKEIKKNIKTHIEALAGKVPQIVDIRVQIDCFDSSNVDVMLDSSFESYEDLEKYAVHPDHVEVANKYVRPYTASRSCMDYEV